MPKLAAPAMVYADVSRRKPVSWREAVKPVVSHNFDIRKPMKKKEPIILDIACTRDDKLIAAKDTLAILSGKWKIKLITTLNCGGALQFMEILRIMDGIGPKMLSKELQDLETNQLVTRSVTSTKPLTVKYELTPHGQTLESIINHMRIWGRTHREKIIGK